MTKSELTKITQPKTISLALQGGGSHAAFTWGVLDRLLEEENLTIEGISGTSVGAINGTLLACGMETGGRKKARQLLENFWRKVSVAGGMLIKPTMLDKFMGKNDLAFNPTFAAFDYVTRMFSPYQFNALDLNPIKDVVEELIDFVALRNGAQTKLFVNATNVHSGQSRIFENEQLSLDVLMASACMPFLSKTVEIDGEPYWSGGFSGNPSLEPLVNHCKTRDIIIIQTTATKSDDVPTSVQDIVDRVAEITFNTGLNREQQFLAATSNANFHRIEAEEILSSLGRSSKFNADWSFLEYLRETGRQSAEDWIKKVTATETSPQTGNSNSGVVNFRKFS